jgi:hypothetical protein
MIGSSARGGGQRVEAPRVGGGFLFGEAHCREKGCTHLAQLAGVEDVALQAATGERVAHQIGAREPLDKRFAFDKGQSYRAMIARSRIIAFGSFPCLIASRSTRKRRRIITTPRSLGSWSEHAAAKDAMGGLRESVWRRRADN